MTPERIRELAEEVIEDADICKPQRKTGNSICTKCECVWFSTGVPEACPDCQSSEFRPHTVHDSVISAAETAIKEAIREAEAPLREEITRLRELAREECRRLSEDEIGKLSKFLFDNSPDKNPAMQGSACESAARWITALREERRNVLAHVAVVLNWCDLSLKATGKSLMSAEENGARIILNKMIDEHGLRRRQCPRCGDLMDDEKCAHCGFIRALGEPATTSERPPVDMDKPPCCRACDASWPGMYLCNICGNKRCPHAEDHRFRCTNSNEAGQCGEPATEQVSGEQPASEPTAAAPDPNRGKVVRDALRKTMKRTVSFKTWEEQPTESKEAYNSVYDAVLADARQRQEGGKR